MDQAGGFGRVHEQGSGQRGLVPAAGRKVDGSGDRGDYALDVGQRVGDGPLQLLPVPPGVADAGVAVLNHPFDHLRGEGIPALFEFAGRPQTRPFVPQSAQQHEPGFLAFGSLGLHCHEAPVLASPAP